MRVRLVLLFWILAMVSAGAESRYTFSVDGQRVDGQHRKPDILSLNGTPDQPQQGDLVAVAGWWLTLDEPGHYVLEKRATHGGSLWRILPDGDRLLGIEMQVTDLRTGLKYEGAVPSRLTNSERRSVRGVKISGWAPRFAKELAILDVPRVCFEHRYEAERKLYSQGGLPRAATRLVLDHLPDWVPAALDFPHLQAAILKVNECTSDLHWVTKSKDLRALSLDLQFLVYDWSLRAETFKHLPELRSLETNFGGLIGVAPDIGNLPKLRSISMSNTDLGEALRDWKAPELEHFTLSEVRATQLPEAKLPKLRSARISPTKWLMPEGVSQPSQDELKRFRLTHPQAEMALNWAEQFSLWIRGCDRIRLRGGGECCWQNGGDLPYYDTNDVLEVSEFLRFIKAHPEEGLSGIMDCGRDSLEFYRGAELIRTLGMWGGREGRPIGFRFALEKESAREVEQWVRRRIGGEVGDWKAREERIARYRDILPQELLPGPFAGTDLTVKIVNSWALIFDSPVALAIRAFGIYGCHEDDWNVQVALDAPVRQHVLPTISTGTVFNRATAQDASDAERNGIARWLFADGHHAELTDEELERLLSGCVRESLVHPRIINRRMVMAALARRNTATTRKLLLEVVTARLAPLPPKPKPHQNALGQRFPFPERPNIPDDVPDAVAAAIHLLHCGGEEAKAEIRTGIAQTERELRTQIEALLQKQFPAN
jgi:hypothetical protein